MKKIRVEKIIAGVVIDSFELPLLLVNLANKFLPNTALVELKDKGFDISQMLEVAKADKNYSLAMEVVENDIKTLIFISLITA